MIAERFPGIALLPDEDKMILMAELWQDVMEKPLVAIRLTRHSNGLYRNDALLLDFGEHAIVVELVKEGEGLEARYLVLDA